MAQLISPVPVSHLDDVMDLFAQAWWTRSRPRDQVAALLGSPQPTVGVVTPQGRLVGFVRVLTDFQFKAVIVDLIVDGKHRGGGNGRRLVQGVLEHPALTGVTDFELYCDEDLVPFYGAHGFAQPPRTRFMRAAGSPTNPQPSPPEGS